MPLGHGGDVPALKPAGLRQLRPNGRGNLFFDIRLHRSVTDYLHSGLLSGRLLDAGAESPQPTGHLTFLQ
jgi:hypothetical protein